MVLEERVSDGAPREPPEGTRDTREREQGRRAWFAARALSGKPEGASETKRSFFSESLILAQNERW